MTLNARLGDRTTVSTVRGVVAVLSFAPGYRRECVCVCVLCKQRYRNAKDVECLTLHMYSCFPPCVLAAMQLFESQVEAACGDDRKPGGAVSGRTSRLNLLLQLLGLKNPSYD